MRRVVEAARKAIVRFFPNMSTHAPPPARDSDSDPIPVVLAIDPGRDKCGVAVVRASGEVVELDVYARSSILSIVVELLKKHGVLQIVLGHATTSRDLSELLKIQCPGIAVATVDETNSTLEARALFWRAHPPQGLKRLIPLSLQTPPRPVDDFAAVVLANRFLRL